MTSLFTSLNHLCNSMSFGLCLIMFKIPMSFSCAFVQRYPSPIWSNTHLIFGSIIPLSKPKHLPVKFHLDKTFSMTPNDTWKSNGPASGCSVWQYTKCVCVNLITRATSMIPSNQKSIIAFARSPTGRPIYSLSISWMYNSKDFLKLRGWMRDVGKASVVSYLFSSVTEFFYNFHWQLVAQWRYNRWEITIGCICARWI